METKTDKEFQEIVLAYNRNKRIEEKIQEIFYNLGYIKNFPIDHELENKYRKCIMTAKRMNRELPEVIDIKISNQDIIDGLKNLKQREITWLKEHSYLYEAYYDGLEHDYVDEYSKKTIFDKITETEELYDSVIGIYYQKLSNKKTR